MYFRFTLSQLTDCLVIKKEVPGSDTSYWEHASCCWLLHQTGLFRDDFATLSRNGDDLSAGDFLSAPVAEGVGSTSERQLELDVSHVDGKAIRIFRDDDGVNWGEANERLSERSGDIAALDHEWACCDANLYHEAFLSSG